MNMEPEFIVRFLLERAGLFYLPEYRFHPVRLWRFDFALPDYKTAIEIEGATWTQGRHTRGKGYQNDCEKYNAATLMGWKVLRYPTSYIISNWDKIHADLMQLMRDKNSGTSAPPVQPNESKPEKIRQGD